jgi:hypothetical protein
MYFKDNDYYEETGKLHDYDCKYQFIFDMSFVKNHAHEVFDKPKGTNISD